MKNMILNENEIRTMLEVLNELSRNSYSKLNETFGSLTIDEMLKLRTKLNDWYQPEVLGKEYDSDYGWYDPNTEF